MGDRGKRIVMLAVYCLTASEPEEMADARSTGSMPFDALLPGLTPRLYAVARFAGLLRTNQ